MSEHWANLDLHLDVDLDASRLGRTLEGALRAAVRDGRLPPGTRLPSSRALGADLGIARNTVADAYAQLVAEGWLTARTGAGTWVTGMPPPAPAEAAPGPPAARQLRYDLRPGTPDLSAFPRREWLAAARRALAGSADDVLDYPDPRGLPRLREALAGYLARARGVAADPDRIVVCAGFRHGLGLLAQVLRARGARAVAVEACSLPEHRAVIARGLGIATLPVDADGAVPDGAVLGAAGAALLTPAHQFPLGMTLAPARRRLFTEWAAGTGAVLVEDDYDGEFRYDRHPVGAMQALAPDHVVYGGTASKALAPGLNLGWLAVPRRLLDETVTAARLAGGGPDVISQLALAEFITSGGYDRQVRHARLAYRRRRDQLVSALGHGVPGVRVAGIAAGLHALVLIRPGQSEAEVIAAAGHRDLAVAGLAGYSADRRPAALVVGYARPPRHAFAAALARLHASLLGNERLRPSSGRRAPPAADRRAPQVPAGRHGGAAGACRGAPPDPGARTAGQRADRATAPGCPRAGRRGPACRRVPGRRDQGRREGIRRGGPGRRGERGRQGARAGQPGDRRAAADRRAGHRLGAHRVHAEGRGADRRGPAGGGEDPSAGRSRGSRQAGERGARRGRGAGVDRARGGDAPGGGEA